MRKALLYIGIALAAIGCAKSEIIEETTSGEISFSAGVATRVVAGENDCTWELGDKIGIFTDQSQEKNLLFTISNSSTGAMTNESGLFIDPLTSEKRTYWAYYPYSSAQDETTTIAVDCTNQSSLEPLLWATLEESSSTAVSLPFSHMYAKVSFSLSAGMIDATSLSDARAWFTGANSKGEFNITTGTFTFSDSDIVDIELTIDKSDYTISPIYLPPSSGVKLWVNDGENTFVKSLDEWESGKEYIYNITIGEKQPSYVEFKRNESNTENMTKSDESGIIDNILSKFRRCLMTTDGNGNATICYLDDNNSELYYDGTTTAALDGTQGDVMVYFPEYWYMYENVDDDYFRYYFSEDEKDGYIHVEASLVGAYKAYIKDKMVYSRSGVTPTVSYTQSSFVSYAASRGTGYQIIDYEQHCTIAMMLYAKYLDRNTQTILGIGGATYTTTGSTNSIGNNDTVNGSTDDNYVNGLGIEGVFGGISEMVQGVKINGYVWTITNPDNTSRSVTTIDYYDYTGGWITSMAIEGYSGSSSSDVGYSDSTTQYFDMVPTAALSSEDGGSATTNYADFFLKKYNTETLILARSYTNSTNGGVAYTSASSKSTVASTNCGSRLAFRGTITEAVSVEAYTALFD